MRYKLLYTKWHAQQKAVIIVDFIDEKLIEINMNDLTNDTLDDELKRFLTSIKNQIESDYWRYDG